MSGVKSKCLFSRWGKTVRLTAADKSEGNVLYVIYFRELGKCSEDFCDEMALYRIMATRGFTVLETDGCVQTSLTDG